MGKVWGKYYICTMATIKYIIKNVSETSSIYLRFKDGASFDLTTKTNFKINSSNWSKTKGQPINLRDADLKKLDNNLKKLSLDLLNHYNNTVDKNEINSQWLKDFINPKAINIIPNKLVDYFAFYELQKRNVLTTASISKLNVNKKLIERFQINTKRVYLIKDVNEDFKLGFYDFCVSEKYSQNTIARALKFIKTICYHAESNNVEISKKLSGLQINTIKGEKIYLDLNELSLIENCKDIAKENLINARDWLLISCETGQRVSDFLRFTKDMIRYENNKPLIEFTQVKTGKIMTIPLSKKVISILERRDGNFPYQISDQKYNLYIKDVCEIAKINKVIKGGLQIDNRKVIGMYPKWQLVTSHIGRRSFATNNYGIIPTALLIGVTGHSTEQMFLEYIGKTDTQKAMALAEYF
jgi:integrase